MHEVKNYKTITHDPQWEIEDELDEKIKTVCIDGWVIIFQTNYRNGIIEYTLERKSYI